MIIVLFFQEEGTTKEGSKREVDIASISFLITLSEKRKGISWFHSII